VVKVIILARTHDEAQAYANTAGLAARDVIICGPHSDTALQGIRLSNEDLIAEFPGFREAEGSHRVIQTLNSIMDSGNTTPTWRKIGT